VTSPTTTYTGSIAIETFTATLPLGGTIFYSFTAPRDGPISLTLLDLKENGVTSEAAIGMTLGAPAGTGCSSGTPTTVTMGATPQFTGSYGAGVYCVKVVDVGNLVAPARFSINIARPQ
jgi:hypothetical protein